METIIEHEELTQETIEAIRRAFPGIQGMVMRTSDIDISRGAGVMEGDTKCVWTHDGHRITMSIDNRMAHGFGMPSGTKIGACSREPDPMAPPGVDP